MRSILIACVLTLSLVSGGCRSKVRPRPQSVTRSIGNDTCSGLLQYGWDQSGQLTYAAFTVTTNPDRKDVTGLVTMGSEGDWLTEPDGSKIKLPADVQLFELVDGQFRTSKERVRKEDVVAFMASRPREYTIEALLAFVKAHEKK